MVHTVAALHSRRILSNHHGLREQLLIKGCRIFLQSAIGQCASLYQFLHSRVETLIVFVVSQDRNLVFVHQSFLRIQISLVVMDWLKHFRYELVARRLFTDWRVWVQLLKGLFGILLLLGMASFSCCCQQDLDMTGVSRNDAAIFAKRLGSIHSLFPFTLVTLIKQLLSREGAHQARLVNIAWRCKLREVPCE